MGSVYFATVGCPKNEVDTQIWLDCLSKSGYRILDNPNEADFLFINTCAFIDDARLESREAIEAMGKIKKSFPPKKLYIVGCWPQMDGERLLTMFPFADAIFGNRNIPKSCESFMQLCSHKEQVAYLPDETCNWYPLTNFNPTTFPYAYLKIAEGCDNFCSYCTLPCIRGPYRSMPINILVEQTTHLVTHGFKEIILIAQETTQYGQDLPDKPELVKLLDELNSIEGDFVIRLMYA
ncbi:30S ribosomal protein S12 methylthiotransferase RimO, partial [bacterium]